MRERAIGRLTLYRRTLRELDEKMTHIFSHQLAKMVGVSAAQLRRDLMPIGYEGSPNRGYEVSGLLASLSQHLDGPGSHTVALIGVGNLGRALLPYFTARNPHLRVIAAFDTDPQKIDRIICGCRVYTLERLEEIIAAEHIKVAIIAVPRDTAIDCAQRAAEAGVTGLLNFAPIPLEVPRHVFVEHVDLTMALEKVNHFAQRTADAQETTAVNPINTQ